MKIIDEALLDTFRHAPRCEICGKPTPSGCDPHHGFISRGAGRIDLRENICACCRSCHTKAHSGVIPAADVRAVIARRERKSIEEIFDALWDMQRQSRKEI